MLNILSSKKLLSFNLTLSRIEKLFLAALFFISFDGFPLIPINTLNRPLSILILIVYYFLSKFQTKGKFGKTELWLFLFILLLWCQTFYQGIFLHNSLVGFNKFIITSSFAFITITSCLDFYKRITSRYSFEQLLELLSYTLLLSLILPLFLGLLQFLALKSILPIEPIRLVTSFLVQPVNFGDVDEGRIQMATTEASHAGNYICFVLIFINFFSKLNQTKKNGVVLMLLIILVIINSSACYLVFLLTFLLYLIFSSTFKDVLKYSFLSIFIGTILYYLQDYYITPYTARRFEALFGLYDLGWDEFVRLSAVDFSVFDRMTSPILGFRAFQETNYWGAGGESFFYMYGSLVQKYFPDAYYSDGVYDIISNKVQTTPKFLLAKFAGELGFLPILGFMIFLITTFIKINYRRVQHKLSVYRGISVCFFFSIASMMDCSYFHFPIIILLTLSLFSVRIHLSKVQG
jgi:hypothetical protein